MATKQLTFKSGEDEITISLDGTVVAVIRYCLNKIYQVELSQKISRILEYQILCHVYLLSNVDAGEKTMPLDAVLALPQHEVRNELRRRDIAMVRVAYEHLTEALAAVMKRVSQQYLSVQVVPHGFNYRDHVHLVFDLHSKQEFNFWMCMSVPNSDEHDLHVVPGYHPCMNGKKGIHMINGDTDHRTHGYAVVRVESPLESRAEMGKHRAASTWSNLTHPFCAKGRSVVVTVREGLLRTKDGVRELSRFLLAALGKTDEYVEVSGGFSAPLKCAHNRLIEKRIPSPSQKKHFGQSVRGSEQHCVWAYRTLLAEGKLEGAYVPKWFIEEDWLGIYKGAEEKPGLY
ncbi:MAG TPA: hypothetical protein VJ579_02290 [Candidatus Paceibacterota bacterium]|nr:hypothetical protein [Candidatus Paceibacterota bacterium]